MGFFSKKRPTKTAGPVSSQPEEQHPSDKSGLSQDFQHSASVASQKIAAQIPNSRMDGSEDSAVPHAEQYDQNERIVHTPQAAEESPAQDGGSDDCINKSSSFRITIIFSILAVVFVFLWCRAGYLQLHQGEWLAAKARKQHVTQEYVSGRRGNILDRNGGVLARSVEAFSVCANPAEVKDPLLAANTLGPILGINPQTIYDKLSKYRNKHFLWLKRRVDDYTVAGVREAHLPGISLLKEFDRVYPLKYMAGQLLGFVGDQEKGLEGLERSLDDRLACQKVSQTVLRDATGRHFYMRHEGEVDPHGEDIRLTIDPQIQSFAENAIADVVRTQKAAWGGALVVDVPTGEILAWAQCPFFNPNNFSSSTPAVYRNRLAQDALEPGSTFKPLVLAGAMQQKLVGRETIINCEGGRWQTKYSVLRDTSNRGSIPVHKVIRYSSNIGMAKIGLMMGSNTLYNYLSELGFGAPTVVPVSQSKGILRKPKQWSEVDTMSISFGQGVSVTPLQMAQAYLILLNNGVKKNLVLVRDAAVPAESKQIFSRNVTKEIRRMMYEVVAEKDGTGRKAALEGVEVAGKTGTAQKAGRAGYGSKRLASFVGFLPASNPKYLILVFIDEPQNSQYGGVIAAPAFKEIARQTLAYAGELDEEHLKQVRKAREAEDGKDGKKQEDGERGYKAAGIASPFEKQKKEKKVQISVAELKEPDTTGKALQLPGHLAKPSAAVPDVVGKTVRSAVELFARAGILPELKGEGPRVVRQEPAPGTPWPDEKDAAGKKASYILWLSEP